MLRKILALLVLTALVCSGAYACRVTAEQQALSEKLIRLHVVANSDSQADQTQKLRVRDAVLARVQQLTASCATAEQARAVLQKNLPLLRQAARSETSDAVAVTLQTEAFSRRVYDTFCLPAGDYVSLRVTLGRGAGHNWWCVAFPALCLPATAEGFEQAAAVSGITGTQRDLLTAEQTTVEIKFRTLEWLQALKRWLCGDAA